jgi:hypothetical protein
MGKRMGKLTRNGVLMVAAALLCVGLLPSSGHANLASGWELFTTDTVQMPVYGNMVSFQGVPLGTFDFGGSIGIKNVGSTDTILYRTPSSTPGVYNIKILAMQFVNTTTYNVPVYVTLGTTPGSGTMTVGNETWTGEGSMGYDIHYGSLNGPVPTGGSGTHYFTGSGIWTSSAPASAFLISGVNYELNGSDTSGDFWPLAPVITGWPGDGSVHNLHPTTTPIPSALILLAPGLLGLAAVRRRFKE